jgi:hypothetical protein
MMRQNLRYLSFGLIVLASYWYTVHHGIVFWNGDSEPAPPAARARTGTGPRPSFWSTGYQGGK